MLCLRGSAPDTVVGLTAPPHPSCETLGHTLAEGPTELRAPGPRDPTVRHWLCQPLPVSTVPNIVRNLSNSKYRGIDEEEERELKFTISHYSRVQYKNGITIIN